MMECPALSALKWIHTDICFSAPELAAEKMERWARRAEAVIDYPDAHCDDACPGGANCPCVQEDRTKHAKDREDRRRVNVGSKPERR